MQLETGGSSWHQTNRGVSIYFAIYLALLVLVFYLSKVLHDKPKVGSFLPEAAMVILVGMVAGLITSLTTLGSNDNDEMVADQVAESVMSFSPSVFFIILLPPVIFNSGYHLRRDLFFRHITPICLFACLGTVICTFVVASLLYFVMPIFRFQAGFLELAAFGALISATDPVSTLAVFQAKKVDPHLFYLVFGESVINDAVGLVLFESLAHLIESEGQLDVGQEVLQFLFDFFTGFIGSLVLGTFFAIAYALLFKYVDFRATPFLELCLFVTIMYTPFVAAEILRLSGIVTVLFTGIAAKRYAEPNLSPATATSADTIFRLVAHLTETVIFLELGLSVWTLVGQGAFRMGFIVLALVFCLLGRAVNIYPIALVYNLCWGGRDNDHESSSHETDYVADEGASVDATRSATIDDSRIPWNTAHMLWFSGLRGAVSYGLARMFPATQAQAPIIAATMCIVLLTTFVLGGSTELALAYLKIETGVDEEEYLDRLHREPLLCDWLHRFESGAVRRCVLRDYRRKTIKDAEESGYHEHVEVVEGDPRPVVGSVYDYGQ